MNRGEGHEKHSRRKHLILLAGMILLSGFLVRSSAVLSPPPAVRATAIPLPLATPAPTWTAQIIATAPPHTAPPQDADGEAAQFTPHQQDEAEGTEFTFTIEVPLPEESTPPQNTPTQAPQVTPVPALLPTAPPDYNPDYHYETENVRIGITRREIPNVVYYAVELWLTDIHLLRSAFSSDAFDAATESVGDIAQRNRAILAINGDFATFNNGGIIIRNGDVYRTNHSTRQLLLIDGNGDFVPYATPPEEPETAASAFHMLGIWHTLVFGPVLVADGQAVALPEQFFISTGHTQEPRTAIAQLGPLHYLMIVVDGRQAGYSEGMSLPRLQELFLEYGAITAFNLDGGGSSTLYFDGEVINKPGNGGQRHVPDILYVLQGL